MGYAVIVISRLKQMYIFGITGELNNVKESEFWKIFVFYMCTFTELEYFYERHV